MTFEGVSRSRRLVECWLYLVSDILFQRLSISREVFVSTVSFNQFSGVASSTTVSSNLVADWKKKAVTDTDESPCIILVRHASALMPWAWRPSIRPSVCNVGELWSHSTMLCGYFDTTRKGNHSSFLTSTVGGGRGPLPSEICAQSDPSLRNTRTLTDFRLYRINDKR